MLKGALIKFSDDDLKHCLSFYDGFSELSKQNIYYNKTWLVSEGSEHDPRNVRIFLADPIKGIWMFYDLGIPKIYMPLFLDSYGR